jgi:hypothetical protein
MKDYEMNRTSRPHGRSEKIISNGTKVLGRKVEAITNMDVKEISCENMYWILLAMVSIRWLENCRSAERLPSYQERFFTMKLQY